MYVAGFDRGVRPIGDWSMSTTLSRCSSPSMRSWSPGLTLVAPFRSRASASRMISLTSELLPDPDTPVTHTNLPSGRPTVMFARLLCRAPTTVSQLSLPASVVDARAAGDCRVGPARRLASAVVFLFPIPFAT